MKKDTETTSRNKKVAKYIAPVLGTDPGALRFWDDNRENYLDVLHVNDPLQKGMKFYATIGVSENNVVIKGKEQGFALELLMGGDQKFEQVPNILSTCGFYIVKDKWECRPGNVFERMVEMYYPNNILQHIYFTDPFVWSDKLQPLQMEDIQIVWLLAVPISDKELQYKLEHGDDAFDQLLFEKKVDVFDLNRKSVC